MSKAIKCDRCGHCFDPFRCDNDFVTIKELYSQNAIEYGNNEVGYRDEELNLCPGCAAEFFDWMSKIKTKDSSPPFSLNEPVVQLYNMFDKIFGGVPDEANRRTKNTRKSTDETDGVSSV